MKLNISEIFYSIQGEGITMGIPSVFLRLGGCNLLCKWCDTIEVWQKSKATPFSQVLGSYEHYLRNGAHLVITGGEPLLHQTQIVEWIKTLDFRPFIEVETNGTIMPSLEMQLLVNQWNCSPKLRNSGEAYNDRVNEVALIHLNTLNTCFKFVICEEGDVLEVLQDFSFLNPKRFIFMPAGATQEELSVTRPMVARECIRTGIRYCDRLHVAIWNQKTGV